MSIQTVEERPAGVESMENVNGIQNRRPEFSVSLCRHVNAQAEVWMLHVGARVTEESTTAVRK